ncbi:MAG: ATP-binding cassette domain-containing protein [Methylovulum sp.]|nr:ATP-binding cassette domain-containing protein [Methylovulum sp.]
MSDIQINITNKSYRGRLAPIIDNLKLSLKSGEFVCLLGQSGCGKTTLLNCIAGLDTAYTGGIMLGGQHTQPKIGYIFQNPRLLPWRTVRENIELALDGTQSPDIIDALLDAMQLTEVQHVYPERLSLGMSRRIAIIRAFAVNPDILLMDEPFVSLDAPTARQVRELLLKLWQKRPHTVLFVTHDLREAIALADRLVFLSASPMRVVSEITVPIARHERNNERLIEAFRTQLKDNYPDIKTLL